MNVFRFVVVLVALIAASQVPGIITHRVRTPEAWIVVLALEILLASRIAATLAHFGEPLRWYGTPALLVASALILWYVWRVRHAVRPVGYAPPRRGGGDPSSRHRP